MEKKKLTGKDLVTTGIYTALYIVALFVACVVNVTPVTFMFYPAAAALLGAVFFIILSMKVQKFGAVIIWGVIVGLLFAVLGMVMAMPFIIVASVIAQIMIAKSGYQNYKTNTAAFTIVSVFSIGGYLQLFLFTEDYLAEAASRGLAQGFVDGLAGCATVPFLLLMIVVTAICALLGCLFAKKILKKHLSKAGIV